MDESLAAALAERLGELGLSFAEPFDLVQLPEGDTKTVTIAHQQGKARYRVGFSRSLTGSSFVRAKLRQAARDPLLLFGPRITERSAELLRTLGINYLDQAGNAYITFEGVHIDVRGRRPPQTTTSTYAYSSRGGVNLFSTKRSQVIFALLAWPDLVDSPIREIANQSGASLGLVQETLELLIQYGFTNERRRFLPQQREHLLDRWAAAYPTGLGSSARTLMMSGNFDNLAPTEGPVYVSGEAAVPALLRPETLVLYTHEVPTQVIRSHRWRRDDSHPNIFLRRQFWPTPQRHEQPGVYQAPWPLVYADLLASNDGRQREAAGQLRESHA